MISETKNVAKSLRKDVKREKLRSAKAHVRTSQEILSKIVRKTLNSAYKRIKVDDSKNLKLSLKTIIEKFENKPKEFFQTWRNYILSCKQGDLLSRINAERLKGLITKLSFRTFKDCYQRIFGSGNKVKGALKSIIRRIEKKKNLAFKS